MQKLLNVYCERVFGFYKYYLAGYIVYGDPNIKRVEFDDKGRQTQVVYNGPVEWNRPDFSESTVDNVLRVKDLKGNKRFTISTDDWMSTEACHFWRDFYTAVTIGGGYVPEGVMLKSDWIEMNSTSVAGEVN